MIGAGAGPADASPAAVPALPTPRDLTRISLDLAAEAALRLRGASIYVALVTVALLGPIVLGVVLVASARPDLIDRFLVPYPDLAAPVEPVLDEAASSAIGLLSIGGIGAFIGLVAMSVESQALAAAILAGVALHRPVSTREALRRSRQVFWRIVGYALLTLVPIAIATSVLQVVLAEVLGDAVETIGLATLAFGALLGLPFAYGIAAIVLGDVGAAEAVRRSILLARFRWRLAIVIVLVTSVAWYLAIFAFLGAIDIIATVGEPLGIGLDHGPLAFLALVVAALGLSAAIGSLLLTVTAIVVAPQVVAFLGLTHFSGGIDLARDEAVGAVAVRPVTIPLVIGVIVSVVALVGALALIAGG